MSDVEPSVFTKIINGEIPCHKVYENDDSLAIMDIYPKQPGQIVVFPKVQEPFIWGLDESSYTALMLTVQKVGRALRKQFPEKKRIGVMVYGLDVEDHAHVVLLPFDTDKEFNAPSSTEDPDHDALAKQAERIRQALDE